MAEDLNIRNREDDEGFKKVRTARQHPNKIDPFPARLYDMLNTCESEGLEDIIGWASHGKGFHLRNQKKFVDELLPKFFPEMKRYQQFQTQLRSFNFRKLTLGSDAGGFFHQKLEFLWGKPGQCRKIKQAIDNATKKGRNTMLADSKSELKYYNKGAARGSEGLEKQSDSLKKSKSISSQPQHTPILSDRSEPRTKAISKLEIENAKATAEECGRKLVALDRLAGGHGQRGIPQLTLQYARKLLNNFPESETVATLSLAEKDEAARSLLETLVNEQTRLKEWAIPCIRSKMVECAKAQNLLWGQEQKKPVTEFQHIIKSWEEDPSDENVKRLQHVLCFQEEPEHSGWVENTEREYLDEMKLMYFIPDCYRKKKGYVYKMIDSVLTLTLGLVNSKGCQHHGLRLSDKFRFHCQPPVAKGFPPQAHFFSYPYFYRPYTFAMNQPPKPTPTASASQTIPTVTHYATYPPKGLDSGGAFIGLDVLQQHTTENPLFRAGETSDQRASLKPQSVVEKQESLHEDIPTWETSL